MDVQRWTSECRLYGATEACCRRFIFVGPAVVGQASQGEVGLGFVDGGGGGGGDGVHCWLLLHDVQAFI